MKTIFVKPAEIVKKWYLIDAEGKELGRVAVAAARILRGKNKPEYAPHQDMGDFVIIVNAEKIRVTGKKADALVYETYSKHPGGRHLYPFKRMQAEHPEKLVEVAIRRMLPKSRLGRQMLSKLKIYRGAEHPHAAQQPKETKFS